jgi:hypothetical protein
MVVIDQPNLGVLVDGDAEFDADVTELRLVVPALPAGVLHATDRRDSVRGFVQQRAEQCPGSASQAFAADEQFRQPAVPGGPLLVVEVPEGRLPGLAVPLLRVTTTCGTSG